MESILHINNTIRIERIEMEEERVTKITDKKIIHEGKWLNFEHWSFTMNNKPGVSIYNMYIYYSDNYPDLTFVMMLQGYMD